MKRKFSAALAFALVGVLVVAVALAVANRKGVLDFLSYSRQRFRKRSATMCRRISRRTSRTACTPRCAEVVYDGHRLWATVDINMDGEKPLPRVLITAWTRRNGRG